MSPRQFALVVLAVVVLAIAWVAPPPAHAADGHGERVQLDPFRGQFVGVPASVLSPPADGEVYLHELEGFAVRRPDGSPLGLVSGFYELPGGLTLEIQGPKREFLLPFRKEFVLHVDRDARMMVVEPPEGLVEESE